jgi:plasmid maintenance system killer protein
MIHVSTCTLAILEHVIFLRTASKQVETCSAHVKVTIWIEIKLRCVKQNRYSSLGTYRSGTASIWRNSSFMIVHIYTETDCTGTYTVTILEARM